MSPIEMYFIDHYDSFSYNVIDWLTAGEPHIRVIHLQCDDAPALKRIYERPLSIVLSPGPRHPNDATATRTLVQDFFGKVPMLGVCLGHQILGSIGGFSVTKASHPFHGSTVEISVQNPGILFNDVPAHFSAATYNSLVVELDPKKQPEINWTVNAVNQHGEIQALTWSKDKMQPAFGVQFHPESFLTEEKVRLRHNWLAVIERFASTQHVT